MRTASNTISEAAATSRAEGSLWQPGRVNRVWRVANRVWRVGTANRVWRVGTAMGTRLYGYGDQAVRLWGPGCTAMGTRLWTQWGQARDTVGQARDTAGQCTRTPVPGTTTSPHVVPYPPVPRQHPPPPCTLHRCTAAHHRPSTRSAGSGMAVLPERLTKRAMVSGRLVSFGDTGF